MSSITLSIINNDFILDYTGLNIDDLYGINLYVQSIFKGNINRDRKIIVLPGVNNTQLTYSKIKKLFEEKYSLQILKDKKAEILLKSSEDEYTKFNLFTKKAREIRNNNIPPIELAEFSASLSTFKRTLKPYQLLASYHLAFSQNACNFSVPGSGKTTTVLAAFHYLKNVELDSLKRVDKILIVGPLSAFLAWKEEYKECYGRYPEVLEIYGKTKKSDVESRLLLTNVKEEVILINYQSLDSYKDILVQFLKDNKTMVVLDEAHKIKKIGDGLWSSAALRLSTNASSRVVLTGTPAANSYVDLFNLYKFIWPHHNVIGYSPGQLANMGQSDNDYRINSLVSNISPFYIRVRKSDLGLPVATFHEPTIVHMGPIQRKIYDAIAENTMADFENRSEYSKSLIKSRLIRMRQAATNPSLLNKSLADYYDSMDGDFFEKVALTDEINVQDNIRDLISNYAKNEVPAKFIKISNMIKILIERGEKVLVWAEFVGNIEGLHEYLGSQGVEARLLYGGVDKEERESIIKDFHEPNSSFRVIIANPHAVGESISLHKACHNAIYLEQSYNAGTFMQSKDRIHRVGLKNSDHTDYYFLHSLNSIDSLVHASVVEKEERMLALIEKEEIPLLSKNADFLEDSDDDVKKIIRDYYANQPTLG